MLILLKSMSLILWLFIMLAVIRAYRGNNPHKANSFKLKLDRDYNKKRRERSVKYNRIYSLQQANSGSYYML